VCEIARKNERFDALAPLMPRRFAARSMLRSVSGEAARNAAILLAQIQLRSTPARSTCFEAIARLWRHVPCVFGNPVLSEARLFV